MKSLNDRVTLESVSDNWRQIVDMDHGDFPTSNQEATMDLVGKLSPLTAEESNGSSSSDGDVVSFCKLQ